MNPFLYIVTKMKPIESILYFVNSFIDTKMTSRSVSYTHLDVYKRQYKEWIYVRGVLFRKQIVVETQHRLTCHAYRLSALARTVGIQIYVYFRLSIRMENTKSSTRV